MEGVLLSYVIVTLTGSVKVEPFPKRVSLKKASGPVPALTSKLYETRIAWAGVAPPTRRPSRTKTAANRMGPQASTLERTAPAAIRMIGRLALEVAEPVSAVNPRNS